MKVSDLFVYPVKSLRGHDCKSAKLDARGLMGDRRWMLVDDRGKFLTQRDIPQLAQYRAALDDTGALTITAPDGAAHTFSPPDPTNRLPVQVWKDSVDSALAQTVDNMWLTEKLGRVAMLVFQDHEDARKCAPGYAPDQPVSYADGFPVLITNTASLKALNDHIASQDAEPVTMRRFRPNLVVEADTPWAEDMWARLQVGACELELVKPCRRCVVTTFDPDTGKRKGEEPLRSLTALRFWRHMTPDGKAEPGVYFGWNAVVRKGGAINHGDSVKVIERR